ncbi:DUF1963 domain-containing protein [Amycolatopsis thermophila]|uniref:DUF1963 domain-containing protein n=1 Tax=Amycolatopsis thermophila TaxID=206084 RepID=UPI003520892D
MPLAASPRLTGPDWSHPRFRTEREWRAVHEEARRRVMPAQIGSGDETGMTWGDVGRLHRLIRPEDLRRWTVRGVVVHVAVHMTPTPRPVASGR